MALLAMTTTLYQGILAIDRGAWVLQCLEVPCDLIQTDPPNIPHGSSSVGCRKGCERENDRQIITRREPDPDCPAYPKYVDPVRYIDQIA